ncbi:hypothetical protein HanRHA438_Chr12g0561841 [Helianthus annuus]|uniref:Uncharacterized protein n=1 Tax=Helianthus annuus TaxID=4232 RepID=A0A9K3MWQ0_HELAN|nr:hypothetical protein HanXRQr2_Chr12g0550551 [Helianthus annuus]KAJ0490059.1 hypothetical protein HanHA300_Chr12g0451091 [Helianthus annuus]KAJ0494143.1 hypothetical protein HanIR_Chr12g0594081 [Helianthus annuus]KAJ0505973.1 hypothetical protein HanHA89_Chr12g0476621 [Helianthus annuus]KAJ0675643.1 hypothetical protein HanLR1_Chr12g0453511 [Helianthus annuus]
MRVKRKRSCSDAGNTNGPIVVMFDLRASAAIAMRSLDKLMPTSPCESSCSYTHLYALSSEPLCVRTTWTNLYLARLFSRRLFDSKIAAAPILNKQLGRSIARSFPL